MSDVEVVLKIQNVTDSAEPWTAERIIEQERLSLETWESLSEDGRSALAVIMRDMLVRLIEDPASWLPTSLVAEPGMKLMVMVELEVGALDERVIQMRLDAERRMTDELLDILAMGEELGE